MPRAAAIALVMALQFVTLLLGMLTIAACSEYTGSGSTCGPVTDSTLRWFAAVLWPTALFAAGQILPWARSQSMAAAVVTVLLAAAFWAYVLFGLP
jgi:hypothetical protein